MRSLRYSHIHVYIHVFHALNKHMVGLSCDRVESKIHLPNQSEMCFLDNMDAKHNVFEYMNKCHLAIVQVQVKGQLFYFNSWSR